MGQKKYNQMDEMEWKRIILKDLELKFMQC